MEHLAQEILAVQRMQDEIESHLDERITPAQLARAAGFSPHHAARLFQRLTGLSPADYIRRLRLSRSALRLRDESVRVIDVAYDAGFGSVDGYQRAFRRAFGCNPKAYAQRPVPLPLFTPYGVKFRALWKERGTMEKPVTSVFVSPVERPARTAIVRRGVAASGYWEYCQEAGCDVWGVLTSMKSPFGEPVGLWLPKALQKPGTSAYVQGVERALGDSAPIPEGFDQIDLPASSYLMFQGEPFAEEDYCEAIEAVQTAVRRYDPAVLGLAWNGEAPVIQLEPVGKRGYIELHAVKPIGEA